ncbi:MAG: cysteine--tRNA ligase [Nitrospirota bacterium]
MIKIFNTLTGKKEEFKSVTPKKVKMYVCGVTVYDYCHLGHARGAVVFDVIRRYLIYKGYDVKYVRNFTDIDDKIINRAREEGVSAWDIARRFTEEYRRDMDALGVERADIEPKATEHIPEMIEIINGLIEKGFGYVVNGDVFFDVSRFENYGRLSKRNLDEMLAGARVEVNERKTDPLDFALWKSSKEDEPSWNSPWGKEGRPGWHIECSAMVLKHLGENIDIHAGGKDLIFPHHENEIAQSEAYTGRRFVNYWMHNGFVSINQEKMSKSLKNFFTIKEVLEIYDPETVRLFLLSTHYRSPIDYSDRNLKEAESTLDRFYSTKERIISYIQMRSTDTTSDIDPSLLDYDAKMLYDEIMGFKNAFVEVMDDDFNTAQVLGHIFGLIRTINRYMDKMGDSESTIAYLLNVALMRLEEIGDVLNLFKKIPHEWFYRKRKGTISLTDEEIEKKIEERKEARLRKDWERADRIRKELETAGILLEDRPEGTVWKVKI